MGIRMGAKCCAIDDDLIAFWCPGCRQTHSLNTDASIRPAWGFNGNGDAPTFTPSVLVNAPGPDHNPNRPTCHSFVTDGRIQFLGDCTHALAGQTIPLPDFPQCA